MLQGTDKNDARCKILFDRLESAIDDLIAKGCNHFIAGNALGIDTWASGIVLEKKKTNPELVLEIAQPYEGHNARRWSSFRQALKHPPVAVWKK